VLIGGVWIGFSLLVLARLVGLARSDSQSDHPWLRALIGVAFVASGALFLGIVWLTGSSQEDSLRRRIEELGAGRLMTPSATGTESL
jgi:cytochrome c biogenesis protein CcdA